jgi:hypothetical protein
LWVEFDDPGVAKKRWNIPARTMTGDFGKDVIGPLIDMGLRLAGSRSGRNARNDLQSYLGGFDSAFLLPEQQSVHMPNTYIFMKPVRSCHRSARRALWSNGNSKSAHCALTPIAWHLSSLWRLQDLCLTCSGMSRAASTYKATAPGARLPTCRSLPRFMAGRVWCGRGARQITPWSASPLHTQTASSCWMK